MNRIKDQANYYKNLHFRDRKIKAVVHLENKNDEHFWDFQLQHVQPGHYHFISQSRNENDIESKGCEQCLKFRPYVNRHFFICIDSDLRLLRGEEDLTAAHHIAQTYTYSWENHSCEASALESRFAKKLPDCIFSFSIFLNKLSRIVYRPLLYLIYCNTPELNSLWNLTKFNACIPPQPKRLELADNGRSYLQKAEELFAENIKKLNSEGKGIPEEYVVPDLTKENAYLHIQGHHLYKLISYIGKLLCKGSQVAFKNEILDDGYPTSGYPEIEKVQGDLRSILNG